jgi:uncharacterized protein YjbI with pentapeptide repeats
MKLHQFAEPLEVTRSRLVESIFNDVNLAGTTFENVNLSNARIHDVKLSHLVIDNANLSHASIAESCLHGMTINGILVTDLLAAYSAQQHPSQTT